MSRYRARLSQEEEIRGTLSGAIYRGYSAYETAVQHGYEGTEEEWLESLKGFSPSASVEQTATGATVTVTDESGETTAEIRNGTDGHSPVITAERTGSKETTVYSDGQRIALILDGIDGVDGTTPTASVEKSGTTATITITDKAGTTTATVTDGTDGYTPVRGTDYWTAQDKAEIVQDVLDALPAAEEVGF